MSDVKDQLERALAQVTRDLSGADDLAVFDRYRRRRHRNQRIGAAVVAFVVTVAAAATLQHAFHPDVIPANDFTTWTAIRPIGMPPGSVLTDIEPFGDGFIATGSASVDGPASQVWLSQDGTTWRQADQGPRVGSIADMAVGGVGVVVLSGSGRAIWYSSDGLTWAQATLPTGIVGFEKLGVAGDRLYAFSSSSPGDSIVLSSGDGKTWSGFGGGSFPGPGTTINDIAEGPSGLVAVGSSRDPRDRRYAVILTSTDGSTWSRTPAATRYAGSKLDRVVWTGSAYIAFGKIGRAHV